MVQGRAVLGGNLDPTSVFYNGTPETVREQAQTLLDATRAYSNFFLSSGCDLPPGTPLENVSACVQAVREF
jgi:uroporphyrinogen decarboxylase